MSRCRSRASRTRRHSTHDRRTARRICRRIGALLPPLEDSGGKSANVERLPRVSTLSGRNMGLDTIYLLKRSKSLQLSFDGLSSHFRPRGCKLREVQLQLTPPAKRAHSAARSRYSRASLCMGGNLTIVRLRRSRLFERPVPWTTPFHLQQLASEAIPALPRSYRRAPASGSI
jgi:hypothetical protein